jgi:hypothetical protein
VDLQDRTWKNAEIGDRGSGARDRFGSTADPEVLAWLGRKGTSWLYGREKSEKDQIQMQASSAFWTGQFP